MSEPAFFVTGGTLRQDAQSYVARAADADVLTALRGGDFCYVLTSRQMGKSSLMVRAAAQLRAENFAVVVLDLTGIGQNLEVEQWYFSLLTRMGEQAGLENEFETYWESHEREAPLQRFMGAISHVYLEDAGRRPLVIFVDEIDYVRSLKKFSADEFFAGIRECYNRRTQDAKFQRVTFCLLGVATPSDLIRDQRMTPFNIGRGIELHDFSAGEAEVLADGLSPHRETASALLGRILSWTSGHPYLTQRLCAEVVKAKAHEIASVDRVCEEIYLSAQARERDDNLHFVRERVLHSAIDRAALLDAYAKVCRGERVDDDRLNPVVNELRLSGIVRVVDGVLRVRNQIYARVFDRQWARDNLPDAEQRRQKAAFRRGVRRVAGIALTVLAVMTVLVVIAVHALVREKQAARHAALASDKAVVALGREKRAALEAAAASQRERAEAAKARAAAERERKANEDRLKQVGKTEAALANAENSLLRLVSMQKKIEALLETIAPLVSKKSGTSLLERAEELVHGISDESADDPRIRLGQAGLLRVCGQLYIRLGDESKAVAQAEKARDLVLDELKRQPGDLTLRRQLFDIYNLIGEAILGGRTDEAFKTITEEDYQRAKAAHQQAINVAEAEFHARPGDSEWRRLYFSNLNLLGDIARFYGHRDEAMAQYQFAQSQLQDLQKGAPPSEDFNSLAAAIYDRLGTLYLDRDDTAAARKEFDNSLHLREQGSNEAQPQDFDRQSDLSLSYNKLGHVFMHDGKWADALSYYQRALTIRRALCTQSPRLEWQRNLGFTLNNVAHALWNSKQNKLAIDTYRERLELAETLYNGDHGNPNLRTDYSNALHAVADILLNVADPQLQDWPKALELGQSAVALTERRDPRHLALLAECLRLNKQTGAARQAIEEASNLLPPKEKRSLEERETAQEIEQEMRKCSAENSQPRRKH